MNLALTAMDPTVAGIFFLIAVVVFVVAAALARPAIWACLVALGLAFVAFVFMWDRFALA
jgi:hypothetical protein